MLPFDILIFGLALWLGLYLVNRDFSSTRLRFAGLGLVAYALGWGCTILSDYAPTAALTLNITRWGWSLFFLPAIFWTGAIIHLLPEDAPLQARLVALWRYALLPLVVVGYLLSISTNLLFDATTSALRLGPGYFLLSIAVLLSLLIALLLAWRTLRSTHPKKAYGVLLAVLLFFALSTGLLLFIPIWLPRPFALLLISFDLLLLGFTIAILDAFDQGEALLPDMFRSFDFSCGTVLLFGGQVVLVMLLGTGLTFPMLVLLLAVVATSIAIQTFSKLVGRQVDKVAFAMLPQARRADLQNARSELREVADALPRAKPDIVAETLDEGEFTRLTRRALSHFGDLARLSSSPLTHLPLVEARLTKRGAQDDALERAAELKALLMESITRLKPRNQGDFGTSDEWRYYNALYFPYVAGLKPYSSRAQHTQLDPVAQKALEWFRSTVPERTLHNWQTAATKLVAQDLRAKSDV